MIEIKNLGFSYKKGGRKQLDGVSFSIRENYLTCLIGRNAAGKSTLIKLIYGSLIPSEGEIMYGGETVACAGKLRDEVVEAYRREVAIVTGEEVWHGEWSCRQMIDLLKLNFPAYEEERLQESLRVMGFREDGLKKAWRELSTGEAMQVKLAFAMARRPKILLLDEPFANLDPVAKTDMMQEIRRRILAQEMGVLISTHLLDEIGDIADYVAVLEEGRLTRFGDREEILGGSRAGGLRELLCPDR